MAEIGKTNLGPNFYPKLVSITNSLGMHPEDVLAIMVSESGIKNNSIEPNAKGGGVFAAMPDTQKRLGFKGTPEEFVQLSGEQQLDYFQKFLQGAVQNAGGPIKSAEQYYVANFVPIAMHLPGIKANDMSTVFLEKNPVAVTGPDGKQYSKKYWDIGIKFPVSQEKLFYNTNTLFHGYVPDAISLGSMKAQVDKNKQSSTYKQALKALSQVANYVPKPESTNILNSPTQVATNTKNDSSPNGLWDKFTGFLRSIHALGSDERENFLISIGSEDKTSSVQYANILSTALNEYLSADSSIHTSENNVELETRIGGDKKQVYAALKQFSKALAEEFGNKTYITVSSDLRSNLPKISVDMNELHIRKFALKRDK